ncbi:MAG: hypothetical protein LBU76_01135 [Azoarcus sp.]|jgi:hypothetical protein|nr:hypothetical protein [Azoarcus sp.]
MVNHAHTAQVIYNYDVSLRNVCAYPVQITAFQYLTPKLPDEMQIKKLYLETGKSVSVFEGSNLPENIQEVVPDDYKLEISANGKTLSLDKAHFLEILKKSDYSREKCGIFCRTDYFSGTIKNPSLCP